MKKLNVALAILVAAVMAGNAQTNTVTSEPVGYVTVKMSAGSGTVKRLSYVSLPLLDKQLSITGKSKGTITAVTATTISDSSAGWVAGSLSAPATPYLLAITSGSAQGHIFHIASSATTGGAVGASASANTIDTITISSLTTGSGISDLRTAGVAVGDGYEIYACDTLSSALGSPSTTGIFAAALPASADTVVIVVNGTASTYWHNGTEWKKTGAGTPSSPNVPLLPYYGFSYSRIANSELILTSMGSVPTQARKVQLKNAGLSLLSQYFPVDTTLATLALQNTAGWTKNALSPSADKIVIVSSGTASTYWHNGTDWRKTGAGSPISNTTVIPAGAMVYINKVGTTSGFSTYSQALPYTL